MMIDTDKLMAEAIRDAIRDGIKGRFAQSYDNPLAKLLGAAVEQHAPAMKALIGEAIAACLADGGLRAEIAAEVRRALGKTLVKRFGGEMERAVNALKSDPATRARITLAIDQIAAGHAATT